MTMKLQYFFCPNCDHGVEKHMLFEKIDKFIRNVQQRFRLICKGANSDFTSVLHGKSLNGLPCARHETLHNWTIDARPTTLWDHDWHPKFRSWDRHLPLREESPVTNTHRFLCLIKISECSNIDPPSLQKIQFFILIPNFEILYKM